MWAPPRARIAPTAIRNLLWVKGVAFDRYGTLLNVGALADACRGVASDPVAFSLQWQVKQLEYRFLWALMGKDCDVWKVLGQALAFTIQRFGLVVPPAERRRLMEAWLQLPPYPDVAAVLPRLREILFVSSNAWDAVRAKSFGLRVCWMNRVGGPFDPLGPRPDLTVQDFEELEAALP